MGNRGYFTLLIELPDPSYNWFSGDHLVVDFNQSIFTNVCLEQHPDV